MMKEVFYTYLGTNGIITTPIYLEGIYSVKKVRLVAEPNKALTKDGQTFCSVIEVPESEVSNWQEVDKT